MRLKYTLLATTLIAAPLAARAQAVNPPPVTGPYVSFGAGGNYMQDEPFVNSNGTASNARLRSRIGPVVVGALGYGRGNGLRVELEGDYRQNRFAEGRGLGFPAAAGGNELKYGPMVNALYDLTGLIPFPYAAPYAGLGVGYQWAQWNSVHTYGVPTGFPRLSSDDSRGALAYQAGRIKLGNDFNHSLVIGVRYNFGAPPPAPPPAPAPVAVPAPAAARSYLVFFDWDKATLTDRARSIVKEAADNSTRVQYTRIEVNGYTDTSGTARYNQGLSMRRAQTVAAELVRDGVPRAAIGIQGFGETHLLVPTGAGVREPQNLRVEIIIR